jgi:beta-1,2-mannobiose phosphorylase / 1,2-beta-oligomannan phosphorylase
MLFRATGPGYAPPRRGQPTPFPVYLGYAFSDNGGKNWDIDSSRPALAPALVDSPDGIVVQDIHGRDVVNYANGCVEDPRLFWLDGVCHMTVACRMFPPGPYWIKDDPRQCSPAWAVSSGHALGRAARDNVTVNVLYRVDLGALARGRYDRAFAYITHLTDPEFGENRDVLLFPEKLTIGGKERYVCLHRPWEAQHYPGGSFDMKPSIWMCASDKLETLWSEKQTQTLLASPRFKWERDRIGASAPPLKIGPGRWLVSYHGKQDSVVGYTQSFMILQEDGQGLPRITHRCSDRVLVPSQPWERPGKFTTPCLFVTGLIEGDRGDLIVSYGAADERVGIATFRRQELIEQITRFGPDGKLLSA